MKLSNLDANTVQNWFNIDDEELFTKHWANKKSRELLIENGYDLDTVIEYQIDHYGLRNPPDVDISNSILTLGCSYTFGTGLDVNDTWPSKLGKLLNNPIYNAGIPGSSNDTAFRLANYLVPKYKPKTVVLLSTYIHRYEFYYKDKFYNYIATVDKPIWIKNNYQMGSELHNTLNVNKNILAITCICNRFDIPFVSEPISSFENTKPHYDVARDLQHPGKMVHTEVALNMKKLMLDFY